jgi:hypothetical protein
MKRLEEATMSRPEQTGTEAEPESRPEADEPDEVPERATPPIDEDVAGSVNAALHDADE